MIKISEISEERIYLDVNNKATYIDNSITAIINIRKEEFLKDEKISNIDIIYILIQFLYYKVNIKKIYSNTKEAIDSMEGEIVTHLGKLLLCLSVFQLPAVLFEITFFKYTFCISIFIAFVLMVIGIVKMIKE